MEFDPFAQPDPQIDDYLAMLERWGLSAVEIRNRELVIKAFEVKMLERRLSMFEVTPILVQGYLVGLVARSGSVDCLRRHWRVLREYFDFLILRGLYHQNPVTQKIYPRWGSEKIGLRMKKPPTWGGL